MAVVDRFKVNFRNWLNYAITRFTGTFGDWKKMHFLLFSFYNLVFFPVFVKKYLIACSLLVVNVGEAKETLGNTPCAPVVQVAWAIYSLSDQSAQNISHRFKGCVFCPLFTTVRCWPEWNGGHSIAQKPQAPTPQAPVRNRQTRIVANAKVRIR